MADIAAHEPHELRRSFTKPKPTSQQRHPGADEESHAAYGKINITCIYFYSFEFIHLLNTIYVFSSVFVDLSGWALTILYVGDFMT